MKILVHCAHFAVSSGRYICDAFTRLGHDIRHVGPEMGRELWGLRIPPGYVWNNSPVDDSWIPDLCVLADSAYKWSHPTIPTVVWGVDSHVRDYRQDGIQKYFLAHKTNSVTPWGDDCTHLPCAYDPTIHTPSPIPWNDRKWDICCLGVLQGYPRRVEILKALLAAGYKVKWGAGLIAEDYAAAYQDSRIALCVSFNGDVAQRVFESAAMGCVVLTDNCADFSLLKPDGFYLPDGEDMLTPENAVIAVQDILADSARAQVNIEKSLAWVGAKPPARLHNWKARAEVVLDWYLEKYTHNGIRIVNGANDYLTSPDYATREQMLAHLRQMTPDVTVAGNGEVWEAVDDDGFDDDLDDFPDEYEGDE